MHFFNPIRLLATALLAFVCANGSAQAPAQTKVETTSVPYTAPTDGPGMYRTYCAVCHGVKGKGDGPVAPAMKHKVSDLTVLSKNNGGKFPEERVYNSIAGDMNIPAHGITDMPTWGYIFRKISSSTDERESVVRLKTLTAFVKSMQGK